MLKDFEAWLKKDDLWEYYHNNPDMQETIFKDFQIELLAKNGGKKLAWFAKNPELTKKHYPHIAKMLDDFVEKYSPVEMATHFEELSLEFPKWREAIENLLPKAKERKIKEYLTVLNIALDPSKFDSEIELSAMESVRAELEEQKAYWENLLLEEEKGTKKNLLIDSKQFDVATNLVFKEEIISSLYSILKDFFISEEQPTLRHILETGEKLENPIIFRDNGNKLADVFKQLYEVNLILNCSKNELELWVLNNFGYFYRGEVKNYKKKYLNDIISSQDDKCKNPIINIKRNKETGEFYTIKA